MASLPTEIASTIQAASIDRHPDPLRDNAPSTSADQKLPMKLEEKHPNEELLAEEDEEDDIPYSVLKPLRPAHNLPPLPDLRFEQSYLRSIAKADTWWKVALITTRDQV